MQTTPDVAETPDQTVEHDLERAESSLRDGVQSVQAWIDVIRDQARDRSDPQD